MAVSPWWSTLLHLLKPVASYSLYISFLYLFFFPTSQGIWVKKSCSFLSAQVANLASQISERELSWGHLKLGFCLLLLYFFTTSWNWLQTLLLHLAESCSCFPTSIWKLRSSQMRLFPVRFLPLIMLTRALFPTLTALAHGWFPGLQQRNFVNSSSLGWFRPKRILFHHSFCRIPHN